MADYATVAEFKQAVPLVSTDAARDAAISVMLAAASRTIDQYCNRPDGFVADETATPRLFAGDGSSIIRIDDAVEVTLVEVLDSPTDTAYTAWAATDWIPFSGDSRFPNFNSLPYDQIMVAANSSYSGFTDSRFTTRGGFKPIRTGTRSVPTVRVTARWGYAAQVPPQVKQACIAQAARWWKRGQSSWADTMAGADFGQLMYTKVLDPDIQLILERGRFVRPAIA